MKDKFGYDRGACQSCIDCEEFISRDDDSVRCANCGCKPVAHEKLASTWKNEDSSSPLDTVQPMGINAVSYSFIQPVTVSPLQTYEGSKCGTPGCHREVEFDINTGREYLFCSFHSGVEDVIIIDDIEEETFDLDTNGGMDISEDDQSCAAIRLPAAIHQVVPVLPSFSKCAIPECSNACYVDEYGTVHNCCGYTHAMEYQRRQALQKALGSNVVKGVSHCLLPECDKLTWPFQNYCGRTHADVGKQRGLIPPSSKPNATSTAAAANNNTTTCIFPNCTSPKYTEANGTVHPYCGKTHAQLAQQLGIFPSVSKPEDQCELEGCTRPRYKEGSKTHEYCCADHARKDAPNREANILTSKDEVRKWLQQFNTNFTVVSLDDNEHAKPPGGALFKTFKSKMMSLPKNQRKTCLAFHGTSASNIPSICQNGYDSSKRCGQSYGAGEYFATTPDVSLGYCNGSKKMLVNELLLGQSGTHHTQHGNIIVMKDPAHDLPRFVVTFQ